MGIAMHCIMVSPVTRNSLSVGSIRRQATWRSSARASLVRVAILGVLHFFLPSNLACVLHFKSMASGQVVTKAFRQFNAHLHSTAEA
jgi:hypothetical protein